MTDREAVKIFNVTQVFIHDSDEYIGLNLADRHKTSVMSYFIIYPKLLELQPVSADRVQCQMTYSMEEYGIYQGLEACQFFIERATDPGAAPLITVDDLTLSEPIYAPFWRGFCLYLIQVLRVDFFNSSGASKSSPTRIFINNVHFDPRKNYFGAPDLKTIHSESAR